MKRDVGFMILNNENIHLIQGGWLIKENIPIANS